MEECTRSAEIRGLQLKFLLRTADEQVVKTVREAVEVIKGQLPSSESADALLAVLQLGKAPAAVVLPFLMEVDEAAAAGVSFRADDLAALEQLSSL